MYRILWNPSRVSPWPNVISAVCKGFWKLFADNSNIFYKYKNLTVLQSNINNELKNVYTWLCANKLSLNVDKSNFVIFHPPQKEIQFKMKLYVHEKEIKQKQCIEYLGVLTDSHLKWKSQVSCITKKIKRSVGTLSKIRYYVNINILVNLHYAIIYPSLTYGILAWGNIYPTILQPISTIQRKALRIMTFSKYDAHSSPLFKSLQII